MSERPPSVAPARRSPCGALEVDKVAANLPFVLRKLVGMAGLAVLVNVVTAVIVALITIALNARADGHQVHAVILTAAISAAAAVPVGVSIGAVLQRRTLRWLLRGEQPSPEDARRALRLPLEMAVLTVVLWTLGGVIVSIVSAVVGQSGQTTFGIGGGTVLAGLVSAGLTFVLITRVNEPVALLALAASPPRMNPVFGLRWRLLLAWLLMTAVPIAGLLFALGAPRDKTHIVGVSVAVAILAIVVSGLSALLSAQSIGTPLRGKAETIPRVGDGDLAVDLAVEDAGEIGLVQNGFNEMVDGLRERERIQDLFGRHVGSAVAAEAISGGVTMRGEARDVVALFVDITGSTRLTRQTEPARFVDMLNRFFEVVVDEVEQHGGLLNKFEGDAALCVFGAPADLPDPAGAALRTARRIRERVEAMGEVEIGIGVAAGPVIAGQIGSSSRLEYTVIGDAVNEAARLTEQAKRVEGRVLASSRTFDAADPAERRRWVKSRTLRLRGREAPTHTYRIEAGSDVGAAGVEHLGGGSLARRLTNVARGVTDLAPGRHPED